METQRSKLKFTQKVERSDAVWFLQELQLVNTSHATTRGENNVDFILAGKGDGEDADGGNSGSGGSGEAPDPAA